MANRWVFSALRIQSADIIEVIGMNGWIFRPTILDTEWENLLQRRRDIRLTVNSAEAFVSPRTGDPRNTR